eukprot:ANDGO_05316.mRNA.1 hypothetical protein
MSQEPAASMTASKQGWASPLAQLHFLVNRALQLAENHLNVLETFVPQLVSHCSQRILTLQGSTRGYSLLDKQITSASFFLDAFGNKRAAESRAKLQSSGSGNSLVDFTGSGSVATAMASDEKDEHLRILRDASIAWNDLSTTLESLKRTKLTSSRMAASGGQEQSFSAESLYDFVNLEGVKELRSRIDGIVAWSTSVITRVEQEEDKQGEHGAFTGDAEPSPDALLARLRSEVSSLARLSVVRVGELKFISNRALGELDRARDIVVNLASTLDELTFLLRNSSSLNSVADRNRFAELKERNEDLTQQIREVANGARWVKHLLEAIHKKKLGVALGEYKDKEQLEKDADLFNTTVFATNMQSIMETVTTLVQSNAKDEKDASSTPSEGIAEPVSADSGDNGSALAAALALIQEVRDLNSWYKLCIRAHVEWGHEKARRAAEAERQQQVVREWVSEMSKWSEDERNRRLDWIQKWAAYLPPQLLSSDADERIVEFRIVEEQQPVAAPRYDI